ncbi:raffinose/stachyose/melibiose transport system permease protein [Nakamurella panacisegetis]|uniref:Raffinose/stachyose/melibiose transport system permease protein n=1 Tax=Nakamurella panacisegetis TaxID=1090615 RepID=A0A1H0QSC6_9ACTN|nr:carbohydrate ABC transporter permease [Nakamurella panacisegetis]SDP20261.1 raffinose/stachyose/melibiose transport system permease protein [Nakamurella panacisegetis]
MKATRTESVAGYVLLIGMALTTLLPFVSIILASFQPSGALVAGISWPSSFRLDAFAEAWTTAGFGHLLVNSLIIAVAVVPISVLLSTLAGYALGVLRVPAGRVIFSFFLVGLTLPVELIVIPLYFDLRGIGLTDSYWGVIASESALFMPFGVFWMRTHFRATPKELIEAAQLDGASPRRILQSVLLPLAGPSLSTMAVLFFMWSWNQFLLVLILIQDPDKRTAPAGLGFFVGQYSSNVPVLCAGTIIVLLPIFLVYMVFQRKFIGGMLQGALKG